MNILNLSDKDFEEKVLKSKSLVLCDFWAEWCGPCKQISPILEELYKDTEFKIAKVNIDENPETPAKFGIMSIPSLLLFKEGKVVSTQVGLQPKTTLKEWIDSYF